MESSFLVKSFNKIFGKNDEKVLEKYTLGLQQLIQSSNRLNLISQIKFDTKSNIPTNRVVA